MSLQACAAILRRKAQSEPQPQLHQPLDAATNRDRIAKLQQAEWAKERERISHSNYDPRTLAHSFHRHPDYQYAKPLEREAISSDQPAVRQLECPVFSYCYPFAPKKKWKPRRQKHTADHVQYMRFLPNFKPEPPSAKPTPQSRRGWYPFGFGWYPDPTLPGRIVAQFEASRGGVLPLFDRQRNFRSLS